MSINSQTKLNTIIDVAKVAGVSVGTVSNVINNVVRVSDKTRKIVMDAIELLNFKPNDIARSLRATTSKLIGFLVPDTIDFYMAIAKNLMQHAYECGYTVMLLDYDYQFEREKAQLDLLLEKRVDGVIVIGGSFDEEYLEKLSNDGLPLLLLDRRIPDSLISTIEYDNYTTMRKLVSALNKSGYKRIGFISETISMTNLEDRYRGFLRGLADNRLHVNDNHIYIYNELQLDKRTHGAEIMKELLSKYSLGELPDVFITTSDYIAAGMIDTIKNEGYEIPKDIGITGFDNSIISQYITPNLTTVNQNPKDMARLAWEMLINMIADKTQVKRQLLLAQEIIIRNSCKI